MNKVQLMTILVVLACIYAILTIKLDIFWHIGTSSNADNINEIILNLSYSILAAVIFYIFIDVIPFYTKRKKVRQVLSIMISGIKSDIRDAKNAIYLPPFTNVAKTQNDFVSDFENKDMMDAYCLGIYGFKNLREFFNHNKVQIRNSIHNVLSYSEFLTDTEIKILADINSSKYINEHFFIKDFENIKEHPDLYTNQKEIGKSIFQISELISKI